MSAVREIKNEGEFDKEVLKSDRPVLVDFYATWCGPCRMMAPVLDGMAVDYEGKVKFAKVNVDDAPDLASKYGVRGVPTMLIFKDGRAVDGVVGFTPPRQLKAKLDGVAGSCCDADEPRGCCCCG